MYIMNRFEPILIGIGETEDPLPEVEKRTKYWVFAGPCQKCGSGGRGICLALGLIQLRCEECGQIESVGLDQSELNEVSYVYWCNRSRFQTDYVDLGDDDARLVELLIEEIGAVENVPRWAVIIIGGTCVKGGECVNFSCSYNWKGKLENVC